MAIKRRWTQFKVSLSGSLHSKHDAPSVTIFILKIKLSLVDSYTFIIPKLPTHIIRSFKIGVTDKYSTIKL